MNDIKDDLIQEINDLSCSGSGRERRIEIDEDGTQRLLQDTSTFNALASKILNLDGVKDALAGFFAARKELAVDLLISTEETLTPEDFVDAFETVLGDLDQAQEMFGVASSEDANVAGLFTDAMTLVSVSLGLTFGVKISDVTNFFTPASTDSSLLNPFFRINELTVGAESTASNLETEIFSGVNLRNGSLSIDVGVKVVTPFEAELSLDGSLTNGLSLLDTITSQVLYEPFGEVSASLPLSIDIFDTSQELVILIEDDNLFDDKDFIIKVDFDACQLGDVFQGESYSCVEYIGPSSARI